jgi:hypothetical protein
MTTPPIIQDDQLPPRKRARYNPPIDTAIDRTTLSDVEEPSNVEVDEESASRVQRIRIKMAPEGDRRTSIRLAVKYNQEEDEIEDDEDDYTTQEMKEETWEDHDVCEMVDSTENWRIIGLSNVGNTCFTNAILQVFSYQSCKGQILTLDIRRFWGDISFNDILILLHH